MSVQIAVYKEKLLLSVKNPMKGILSCRQGFRKRIGRVTAMAPCSISAIAELHGGQALFSANAGVFSLKVMIPLNKTTR